MTGTTERQFFSGNTVEQAVLAAARHYGLDPSRVAYTLRDKKHGFLNLRRRVVIEVDPAAPEHPEQPEQRPREAEPSASRAESKPRAHAPAPRVRDEGRHGRAWRGEAPGWTADHEPDPEAAAVARALGEIAALLEMSFESSVRRQEDGLEVEIFGDDSESLVDRQGTALDAIEHLLPRMVRGMLGHPVACRVDSGGFRAAHREEMRQLAEDVAEEVRRDLQPQTLEPMNPADRRLVHMALAEDPTVRTESEGAGFLKRVRISPT